MKSQRKKGSFSDASIKFTTIIKLGLLCASVIFLINYGQNMEKNKKTTKIRQRADSQIADYEWKKRNGEWSDSSIVNGAFRWVKNTAIDYGAEVVKLVTN